MLRIVHPSNESPCTYTTPWGGQNDIHRIHTDIARYMASGYKAGFILLLYKITQTRIHNNYLSLTHTLHITYTYVQLLADNTHCTFLQGGKSNCSIMHVLTTRQKHEMIRKCLTSDCFFISELRLKEEKEGHILWSNF